MTKYLWKLELRDTSLIWKFDSAVVCANSEEEARRIHPATFWGNTPLLLDGSWQVSSWVSRPEEVLVTRIGVADESVPLGAVICASFNEE